MASATVFQTKLALYTSYVVGRPGAARRRARRALLGYRRSLSVPAGRPHRDRLVIFGGEDHKTGQATTRAASRASSAADALIREIELTHRWSGQVIETPDGLPYIGETADASVRRDRFRATA